MKLCRIEMLGGLRVVLGDHVITRFRSHKASALLSYLALYLHRNHSREYLLELFWPDMPPKAARDNLSTALSLLRRQLEAAQVPADRLLVTDYQNVRLHTEHVTTDVEEFEQQLKEAARLTAPAERAALLERTVWLYRGELLPGCYEEWAVQEQERLKTRYGDALQRWTAALAQAGDWETALTAAQQALQTDPYREETYQALMWLHAVLGRPVLALETYQKLEAFFRTELSASPSAASRALAERLQRAPESFAARRVSEWSMEPSAKWLNGESESTDEPIRVYSVPAQPSLSPSATSLEQPLPDLPVQFTHFFGREEELVRLRQMLGPQGPASGTPQARLPRLITLTGPGGAGKTRLALEVAERAAAAFAGRVWFTPLAEVPNPTLIPFALANTLKLPTRSSEDLQEQIVALLKEAPCLLVLDNFEHLLQEPQLACKSENPAASGSTAFVRRLLERLPDLHCLVTSRQPLHLSAEQEFPVTSLALPPLEPLSPEELMDYGSVALYADRARAVKPDFAVTAGNAASIAALCRKLEGMPLAIEMTAAWTRTLPPARILERLEHQLDLLVSRRSDLPPRHQSLRATIEWSYNLLSPALRDAFISLSVFRGGWSLEAAEAILEEGASLQLLEALAHLQERSLIVADEQGEEVRYRLLEPLREFAMEKLIECGMQAPMSARHAHYFLLLAEERHPHCFGPGRQAAYRLLTTENDNVVAALAWYESQEPEGEKAFRLANAMTFFWVARGYWQERRVWLEGLAARITFRTEARARALIGAGRLAHNEEDYARALARCQEALTIMQEVGCRSGAAEARLELGIVAMEQGDFATAQTLYEESLAEFRVVGEKRHRAELLYYFGILAYKQGRLSLARERWESCYALEQEMGVRGGGALWILGRLLTEMEEYAESRRVWRQHLLDRCLAGPISTGMMASLEEHAMLAAAQGQWERAGRLWGAASVVRKMVGKRLAASPAENREHGERTERLREALGPAAYESAFAAGSALSSEQAIAYALEDTLP